MSITYTPQNFSNKNDLLPGDPDKLLDGADFDREFGAISTAFASAAGTASPSFSGTASFDTVTTLGDVTIGGNLSITGRIVEDTVVNLSFSGTYALGSGTAALVFHTANGNVTYTDSVVEGQNITLMLDIGSNSVTWPTGIRWVGGYVPDLDTSNSNVLSIWKVNNTLFGSWGGSVNAS